MLSGGWKLSLGIVITGLRAAKARTASDVQAFDGFRAPAS